MAHIAAPSIRAAAITVAGPGASVSLFPAAAAVRRDGGADAEFGLTATAAEFSKSLTPHHPVYEQQLPSTNPRQVYPLAPPQVPSGEVVGLAGVGVAAVVDVAKPDSELATCGRPVIELLASSVEVVPSGDELEGPLERFEVEVGPLKEVEDEDV
ncbi:hypothetical protein PG994_013715 [Apiospora phragmitis]|uniref:Uncharacterized protein n=1 Tax=Apiospora phragmitis TaxID=2905665 RepID=A0ABR1T9F8_9PEZI